MRSSKWFGGFACGVLMCICFASGLGMANLQKAPDEYEKACNCYMAEIAMDRHESGVQSNPFSNNKNRSVHSSIRAEYWARQMERFRPDFELEKGLKSTAMFDQK